MAIAMALGLAAPVAAAPLLSPNDERPDLSSMPGVSSVRALTIDVSALAELRARVEPVVERLPLGHDRSVDLLLTRFEPFTEHARLEVVTATGTQRLARPDQVYFAGHVRGRPRSRAVLIARPDSVHGFVSIGNETWVFGPHGTGGGHRSYALSDVAPVAYPPPGDFCHNDYHPVTGALAALPRAAAPGRSEAPVTGAVSGGLREVEVAVETDWELRQKFGSDQAALDWVASLMAAASAIYERDVNVRLTVSYVRVWNASDPWTAGDPLDALDEVQAYWLDPVNQMPLIAGQRDLVHFVSGKPVRGGVAYLYAVCNQTYGFGVSQVYGGFDLSDPSDVWDVLVVTHELGHNLGSPHSHCYDPPVDRCYNQEPGCYDGAVVNSRGTAMSYCHLLGGVANIDLELGTAVSEQITSTLASASCVETVPSGDCGNGVVESGEQCDDGNAVPGDGCAGCRLEVCGDGLVDPGEQCDDGNLTNGDGCSTACEIEHRCGDGTVDPGEVCDDGNTRSGDGCSSACLPEPCRVLHPAQTLWSLARVRVRHPGAPKAALIVNGAFGLPMAVETLRPEVTGIRLMLEGVAGSSVLDASLPGGGAWQVRRKRWVYRDGTGAVAGIRKVVVRDRTRFGVPEVQVKVIGRSGPYGVAATQLPLVVTLILEETGQTGACGRFAFGGAACGMAHRGSKLQCR